MSIPSETVKAAQRLLAERERFGLAKYGTTVDRTDLGAGDWLQHAIEEASDLLLYLIRLRQTLQATPVTDFNLYTSPAGQALQPAPAAAPEDAERGAYAARWKDAPKGATHLSENMYGGCWFHQESPILTEGLWLTTVGGETFAGGDLLGCVRCEPRPTLEGGQGVEG